MQLIRSYIGCLFLRIGMACLPADVKRLVRGVLMYHVPGALSADELAEVSAEISNWKQSQKS